MRPIVSNHGRGAALHYLKLRQRPRATKAENGAASSRTDWRLAWASSLIHAGASALFLLIADLFPTLWYLSFVALSPLLFRISRADRAESCRLGALFGLAFIGVRLADSIFIAPAAAVTLLTAGTVIITLFAWTVSRTRDAWGFNPLVVALLWVVFELGLIQLGVIRGVFPDAELGTGFLQKTAILLGFLAISFVIVLFNSLLVVTVNVVASLARARGEFVTEGEGIWDLFTTPGLVAQMGYLAAEGRGPPALYGLCEPRSGNIHGNINIFRRDELCGTKVLGYVRWS